MKHQLNLIIKGSLSLIVTVCSSAAFAGGGTSVPSNAQESGIPYKVLITEDFSNFTGGSEDTPSKNPVNDSFQFIPDEKTLSPGWQGVEIYEAAGTAYQNAGGMLFTPTLDLSKNGGDFKISFRMKLAPGSPEGYAYVQHYSVSSQYSVKLTEEWQTIEYYFDCGVSNDYLAIRAIDIANSSSSKVKAFIDDIVIEIPDPAISTPANVTYDDFDGRSFTAFWNYVKGADCYDVCLFTMDPSGNRKYIEKDLRVSGLEQHFEGLDENWNGYYFTVRASAGGQFSPYSSPQLIEGLPAPEIIDTNYFSDYDFTASWKPVDGAVNYEIRTYYEHTPVDDERFYLVDTDFSFVDPANAPQNIDAGFEELPGWFFGAAEFQEGYIGVQGAFSYIGYAAQIESPILDLTPSGGKISVSFKVKNDDVRTGVGVGLFARSRGDYELVDNLEESDITKNWRTISGSLSKGTDRCILAILPTRSGNIYVDDLKVYMNVKQGQSVSKLASFGATAKTKATVKNLQCPAGDNIYYTIRAVGVNSTKDRYIYSQESPRIPVHLLSTPEISAANGLQIDLHNSNADIINPNRENVRIYDVNGNLYVESDSEMILFSPANHGIFIVKSGDTVKKFAL